MVIIIVSQPFVKISLLFFHLPINLFSKPDSAKLIESGLVNGLTDSVGLRPTSPCFSVLNLMVLEKDLKIPCLDLLGFVGSGPRFLQRRAKPDHSTWQLELITMTLRLYRLKFQNIDQFRLQFFADGYSITNRANFSNILPLIFLDFSRAVLLFL